MTLWTSSRSQILLQAIDDSNYYCRSPESLESSVNRLQSLFNEIRQHFVVNNIYIEPKWRVNHIDYDGILYNSIINYINTDGNFHIMKRPELTETQLNTVKHFIETVTRLNFTEEEGKTRSPDKKRIILRLSEEYDIANDKFIEYYENIFNDLDDNLNDEIKVNPKRIQKVRHNILNSALDPELFTKLFVFLRSEMVTEK